MQIELEIHMMTTILPSRTAQILLGMSRSYVQTEFVDQLAFEMQKWNCLRFKRFDLEDSKYCDANPNNDKKGPPSVFELSFQDEVGDWVSEKFCHTLGEDRFLHRTARSGTNRNFESG